MLLDENDRLRAGTLPIDPEEGAVPMEPVGVEDWDEHLPFLDLHVPPFPLDVLPEWLASWCAEQATAIQVPCDLPALLALAVVSLAISKKVAVEVKPGWREPTNLYTAIALAPGLGKSPVFAAATAPLRQWEREERVRLAPKIAVAAERAKTRDERVKALRKKAASACTDSERREIETDLAEIAVMEADDVLPVAPRLLADDATPEAVGRLLAEQRGRLGVFSSEGGPFKILAGRYSEGRANCELFCKAHSGDAYDLDRIGRPSIHLAAPLLTVALTVQPGVISGLASTPEFRSVGLLARFLYAIPQSALGKRHPDPDAVGDAARSAYERAVHELLAVEELHDEHGEIVPHVVPLEERARTALVRFKAELEPRLGPDGDLHSFADWGNKLPGMVARLAGVLHLAGHPAGHEGLGRSIGCDTMDRSIRIGTYAIEHARAAFGLMGTDPTTELAKIIWGWALRTGQGAVTRREIHRAVERHVQRAVDLDPALARLVERGLLRELHVNAARRPGRPSSPAYAINPRAKRGPS
jgi:hypothetical protein